MSLILVSAYLCLSGGTASQKLIESRIEIAQNARVALALMAADLRCACPLSKEFEFLGMNRELGEREADNLDFATHNYAPRRAREGDFCEVSYFLERDREFGTLSLWRRRDPTPDTEPLGGGEREEIARGVAGLKFEYYDGLEWFDEWGDPEGRRQGQSALIDPGNLYGLPEAVRVTLSFDSSPADSSTDRPTSGLVPEKSRTEPPLVFQTVVRLNLAGKSASASSGSPGGSASGASAGQAAPAAVP